MSTPPVYDHHGDRIIRCHCGRWHKATEGARCRACELRIALNLLKTDPKQRLFPRDTDGRS